MKVILLQVFVGRPPIWGVAVGGENGAKKVLQVLRDELDLTMALCGMQMFKAFSNHTSPNGSAKRIIHFI